MPATAETLHLRHQITVLQRHRARRQNIERRPLVIFASFSADA